MMDFNSLSQLAPLIITLGLGFFGIWFAIRAENSRLKAELREDIRQVERRIDAMSVRVSAYEIEQAELRGAMRILGRQTHTHEPKRDPTDDA